MTNQIQIIHSDRKFTIIDTEEYENLKNTNTELKLRVTELCKDKNILQELLLDKDKTIEELRKENEKLIILEREYSELKIEHNNLKVEHNELKDRFDKSEQERQEKNLIILFKKYATAFFDLYNYKKSEIKTMISVEDLKQINKMNRYRISMNHYYDNTEDIDVLNNREALLYEKYNNMPPKIQERFNKLFPNVLNILKPFLITENKVLMEDDWWD